MSSYQDHHSLPPRLPHISDQPIPSPPPEMPPLPRGPPPSSDIYRFGDTSQQPTNGHPGTRQQNEFSFRSNDSAPQDLHHQDYYRPTRSRHYAAHERERLENGATSYTGQASNGRNDQNRSDYRPRRGRGNRNTHATADRPLLRFHRDNTPEQLLGMNNNSNGVKRFLPANDISDSAEEDMVESESDQLEPPAEDVLLLQQDPSNDTRPRPDPTSSLGEQSLLTTTVTKDVLNIPKWSNPDPYTALPPPDESQRKKRDVIKLIRKARVVAQKDGSVQNQVVANDDFISFDFGNTSRADKNREEAKEGSQGRGEGVPGAPLGPRVFSHLQNLHLLPDTAPGTIGKSLSADTLGPPPAPSSSAKAELNPFGAEIVDGNKKRKRTEDFDVPRPPKRKKGKPGFSNGSILEEWSCRKGDNPIPWIVRSHKMTEHTGFRLHKEICDFYEFVKPQQFEHSVRQELLYRLQKVFKDSNPDCELHCFGSFAAGLYLPNADMDLVVVSKRFLATGIPHVFQSNKQMYKIADHLRSIGFAEHDSVEVIAKAKVPLIKFVDRVTSLRVDLSFENTTGLVANETFDRWKKAFPAMPIIVTLIKQFLMMRGLNEVVNGGLGGFSVTCLVTSLLQNMPRVQTGDLVPEQHLGEILIEFLDLYGNQIDISRTGIVMEPPGYFNKRQYGNYDPNKADRLAIMDPNISSNDISGGSRNVTLIFEKFSQARDEILSAMASSNRLSLLYWMLGGDYSSFLWQRNRLRNIYQDSKGRESVSVDAQGSSGLHKSLARNVIDGSEAMAPSLLKQPGSTQIQVPSSSSGLVATTEAMEHTPTHDTKPMETKVLAQSLGPVNPEPGKPAISQQSTKKKRGKTRTANCQPIKEQIAKDQPLKGPSSAEAGRGRYREKTSIRRSESLKVKYPGIENVPRVLSQEKERRLMASHLAVKPGAQRLSRKQRANRGHREQRFKKGAIVRGDVEIQKSNVVTRSAMAMGGSSNSNPITID